MNFQGYLEPKKPGSLSYDCYIFRNSFDQFGIATKHYMFSLRVYIGLFSPIVGYVFVAWYDYGNKMSLQ